MSIAHTKRRIKSIGTTRKITKAMELIATAKLKSNREIFDKSAQYTEDVYKLVQICLANLADPTSKYLKSTNPVTLHIVVTSNIGLCGSYNSNVIKLAKSLIKQGDKVVIFGEKGIKALNKLEDVEIIRQVASFQGEREADICLNVADEILELFDNDQIGQVNYIYTEFVNSLTFVAKSMQLLPVDLEQFAHVQDEAAPLFYEPDVNTVLDTVLPLYFETLVYGLLIESQVSEQAMRRIAMENATDNADDIKEKLMIEYNKARQASITQEISEVVSGANAAK